MAICPERQRRQSVRYGPLARTRLFLGILIKTRLTNVGLFGWHFSLTIKTAGLASVCLTPLAKNSRPRSANSRRRTDANPRRELWPIPEELARDQSPNPVCTRR